MDQNKAKRNKLLAEKVIKGLQSRNMEGYYVKNKEEALKKVFSLIPRGSSIGWGGSASVDEIGFKVVAKTGEYVVFDRDKGKNPIEKKQIEIQTFGCDYYLCSSNAITEDGILVNIDGNSNRVAAIAYGPTHVIMVVGMNKVAKDLDAAICRARNEAAPINAQRFELDTPCRKNGSCANCMSKDTICCQFLVTRFSRHEGRIKVILVGEDLGF
ncbi:MAG: lactate utilization protein [Lachnospiraceae bacterium]|nr:lactate utilization protein [Lachnospiraceae bacterium]MBR6664477.1 lactate utilization protein [Lachnospiraceae bacterium]